MSYDSGTCPICWGRTSDPYDGPCRPCLAAQQRRLDAGECFECGETDGRHVEGGCTRWRDEPPPGYDD